LYCPSVGQGIKIGGSVGLGLVVVVDITIVVESGLDVVCVEVISEVIGSGLDGVGSSKMKVV